MQYGKLKPALRLLMPAAAYRWVKRRYWGPAANTARRAAAGIRARALRGDLASVETLLLFIGYPRSGHSLIGSLLNAHPEIVIAHELNALWYVDRGFTRDQLFARIIERDRWFDRHGRQWTEYNYTVPGQWQGRYRRLRVIGDKKGDGVTDLVRVYPGLLVRLETVAGAARGDGSDGGLGVRIIHAVRSPFDNIATMQRRTGDPLDACIERHRNRCAINQSLIEAHGDRILTVRHEDLIDSPHDTIRGMTAFLGLDADRDFLEACAGILYRSPNRSRSRIEWSAAQLAAVERIIARTPFLSGYSFDS